MKFGTEAIANLPASPASLRRPLQHPHRKPKPRNRRRETRRARAVGSAETETKGEDTASATPASNEFLSEVELNSLSIQLIRKLASAKKVRAQGTRAGDRRQPRGPNYRS